MNLNEIIDKITSETKWIDDSGLVCTAKILREIAEQLTPRSMNQKPDDEQWCLIFYPNTEGCFIARYHKPLDCFIDHNGCYGSSYYKWLPVPEWKERE